MHVQTSTRLVILTIEIVVNLETACYKKKARQNLEYKVFTYRFTNS